jgi:hypothetical protein
VLGASQFNGRPSAVFRARLNHALTLYKDGVAPNVVTVGGSQPGDAFTEATAGRNYLVSNGVPASAVTAVGVGNDTLTSLRAAAKVLHDHGWHKAVLVTDPWHEMRSMRRHRRPGPAPRCTPAARRSITSIGRPWPSSTTGSSTDPSTPARARSERHIGLHDRSVVGPRNPGPKPHPWCGDAAEQQKQPGLHGVCMRRAGFVPPFKKKSPSPQATRGDPS